MIDLALDFDNKTIKNQFLKGKQLIMQKVILALQCWTGDWFLDGDYGIPYESRTQNKSLLIADIQDIILSVEGVVSVQDIEVTIRYSDIVKKTGKIFDIKATIITDDNEQVTLNGLVPIIGI